MTTRKLKAPSTHGSNPPSSPSSVDHAKCLRLPVTATVSLEKRLITGEVWNDKSIIGLPKIKIGNGIKIVNPLSVVCFLISIIDSVTRGNQYLSFVTTYLSSTTGDNWSFFLFVFLLCFPPLHLYYQVIPISFFKCFQQIISTILIITVFISQVFLFNPISQPIYINRPLNYYEKTIKSMV